VVLKTPLKDLVLSVFGWTCLTLVDSFVSEHLLEGSQAHKSLRLVDWQGAEWVELRVFSIPQPLALGGNGRHAVSILAWHV
jgi:hypothetical protein